jgi:hypothetical protein
MGDRFLGTPLPRSGGQRASNALLAVHGGLEMLAPGLRAALEELGLASVSALGNMGKTPEDCLAQLKFIAIAFTEGKVAGEATGALLANWDEHLEKMSVGVKRVLQANGILSDMQARAVMGSSLSSKPPLLPRPSS